MASRHLLGPAGRGESLTGERTDRLEQMETCRSAGSVDVDERSSRQPTHGVGDGGLTEHAGDVGGDHRSGEHRQFGEGARLVVVEARLRPGEDVSEAAMSRRHSALR